MKPVINYRRFENSFLSVTGSILIIVALGMIVPLLVNFIDNEPLDPFMVPIITFLVVGTIISLLTTNPETQSPTTGLLVLAYTWVLTILCGAIPYVVAGVPVMDSIFESCSGFTTAGASVMTNESNWSSGILVWRSITQWIGGIAIIFIFLFILPTLGFGSRSLFVNEMSGSGTSNLTPKMRNVGKQFVKIYLLFTILAFVAFIICGLNIIDSFTLSMTTISTGGFTPEGFNMANASIAVKICVIIFMFLGSVNFFLHFKAIYKRDLSCFKNEEFIFVVLFNIILVAAVFIITCVTNENVKFIDVVLDVVGATTTTGFVSNDFTAWAEYGGSILIFFGAVLGGSAGSTSGGIKVGRALIVVKHIYNELKKTLHPNGIYDVKMDKVSVPDNVVSSSLLVVILFAITITVGTLAFIIIGLDFENASAVSIGCITTIGFGVEEFGPMGSFVGMSVAGKIIMCILMWLGRLEILTALIMFTPGYWREFLLSNRDVIYRMKMRFRLKKS